ncbi:MAG: AIPR family protein [Chloroflexi bacterium]|nr:AIPR family protein [Chloroflexota bacterium]
MWSEPVGEEIQDIASRYYSGHIERAFLHWALKCVLADVNPDDNDLAEHTALDGAGDLGIDAYWFDELNRRIVLIQAQHSGRILRQKAVDFRGSIEALINQDYVRSQGNAALREIYPDLFEFLLDDSCSIYGVLACGGRVAPSAHNYVQNVGSRVWQFDFEGATRRKEVQLEVLDIEGLISLRQRLIEVARQPVPNVDLPIAMTPDGLSCHPMKGDFRAFQATVPTRAIAEIYERFRSGIFRFNPRGPLGANKVNKEIARTLQDEIMKRHFHLLNNGLTIVCDSVEYDPQAAMLHVRNFQVVNGCQTVYTLFKFSQHITENVLVGTRVVEGLQSWAPELAKATNYQTLVRPEQLASLGAEHDQIKRLFDRLSPPWFYEKQQGFTSFLAETARRSHRARYGRREVTTTELGQLAVAFMGYPVLAKYELKVLFERVEDRGDQLYRAIFIDANSAEQLLLPIQVGRRVYSAVKQRVFELREQARENEGEPFSELDWLPYARMHMIALIGEYLRHKSSVPRGKFLSPDESRRLLGTIDDWFSEAYMKAYDAVEFYIEVDRRAERLVNLREFFRAEETFSAMADRVRRARR